MNWEDVRNLYPDQFVKFEILKSHVENNDVCVDDIEMISPIPICDATNELLNSKNNTLVYHTSKKSVKLKIRKRF